MPRSEDERLAPVLAREGRTPIMHLVSTRRWGQLRGGVRGAQRTRTHPEAYQAGPGCWGATGSHGGVGACSGKSPPGADPRARSGRRSPAGAGLRGAGLGGRGPQLAWVNADLLAQPQSSALPLSVSSASGHSPSATRLRRETSRRFVSCSWICYRPYTFSSRPKRARFQAGEGARIGNPGSPSLPVKLPGASGTPGLCLSVTSSFSG